MNDLILLAALLDGPKHGWVLKKVGSWVTGHAEMHSNLVYPTMKKFVNNDWVKQRSAAGKRGQTRRVYSLTARGRQELFRKLGEFQAKQAASASEFRLRVGLFGILNNDARARILGERGQWLMTREKHFVSLQKTLEETHPTVWGLEVVSFLLSEVRAERHWIARLDRAATVNPYKGLSASKASRR
jgi:DNA-binding PadR family transcriptional regulator